VGFSLETCCRIWLGPPIHFILIPDPIHTYKYINGVWHTFYVVDSHKGVLTPQVSP
jgi:hypothetical protein